MSTISEIQSLPAYRLAVGNDQDCTLEYLLEGSSRLGVVLRLPTVERRWAALCELCSELAKDRGRAVEIFQVSHSYLSGSYDRVGSVTPSGEVWDNRAEWMK